MKIYYVGGSYKQENQEIVMKINIAIAGGSCTGKSTLAAALFAELKRRDFDYDLIGEESRKLKREFGTYRSPFERLYMWRQQEREELRSTAFDGFVTDAPLFHLYVGGRMYASESRDSLAVRELFRMCLEIENRYQLIVIANDPNEISYKTDEARKTERDKALKKHYMIRSFVEHFWLDKLFFVKGNLTERVAAVLSKREELGNQ